MIRRGRCTFMRFLILFYGGLAVYGLVTLTMENLVQSFFMEVLSVLVDLSYHQFDLCDFLCAWSSDLSLK